MTEALRAIKRDLGNEGASAISADRVKIALSNFAKTRRVENINQLKLLCYGLFLPVDGQKWCLIDRDEYFEPLLASVINLQTQIKQFRRCYQGLLGGYFSFNLHTNTDEVRKTNWETLSGFLLAHLWRVLDATKARGTVPEWLGILAENKNLLGDEPCKRYSTELMTGKTEQLNTVCSGLGITATSWVWTEALLAYVNKVCLCNDREFAAALSGVLKLVNGRSDLRLPDHLADRATAKIVIRYSACAERTEHSELRDTCLQRIGNPWLNRTAWDAQVNHEPARVMVEGWIKRRLIRDFFELLAHDGNADVRRLNYWLKWEPQITDMWFVLGADARRNQSAAFDSVRKRMGSSARNLVDSDEQNNAFVMRIGPLLAIEFGMTGNACFLFAAEDFNADLNQMWLDKKRDLKQLRGSKKLPHLGYWESTFDSTLRDLLRTVPSSRGELRYSNRQGADTDPASSDSRRTIQLVPSAASNVLPKLASYSASAMSGGPLMESDFEFIRYQGESLGIEIDDNRRKGGSFWVMVPDRTSRKEFTDTLERLGFNFAPKSKGFWYKRK